MINPLNLNCFIIITMLIGYSIIITITIFIITTSSLRLISYHIIIIAIKLIIVLNIIKDYYFTITIIII